MRSGRSYCGVLYNIVNHSDKQNAMLAGWSSCCVITHLKKNLSTLGRWSGVVPFYHLLDFVLRWLGSGHMFALFKSVVAVDDFGGTWSRQLQNL